MEKIIFLDIDGPLATNKEFFLHTPKFWKKHPEFKELNVKYPFNSGCVEILNEIIEKTDSEIILSSDWKYHWDIPTMDKIFKLNGVVKSPIDITTKDVISPHWLEKNRAFQIGKYIQDNDIKNYVVIDDLDISNFMKINNDDDKFILVNNREGLKQCNIKENILKILNKEHIEKESK